MTLPSSGALTLNDIQTEFGGSNPIGLNEYYAGGGYVPAGTSGTNGAVPSSGAISIYQFYGTSNFIPAWIIDFGDQLTNIPNFNATTNALLVTGAGVKSTSGSYYGGIIELTTTGTGTVVYSTFLAQSPSFYSAFACAVDSSGNKYIYGNQANYPTLLKVNSSNVRQWEFQLNTNALSGYSGGAWCVIPSGTDVYFLYTQSTGGGLGWCKYPQAGGLRTWSKLCACSNLVSSPQCTIGLGNTYFYPIVGAASTSSYGTIYIAIAEVLKSTGLVQTRLSMLHPSLTAGGNRPGSTIVDSADNIYVTFTFSNYTTGYLYFVKFTTGLTLSVCRAITLPNTSADVHEPGNSAVDSAGNVYIVCSISNPTVGRYSGGINKVLIVKYNSSGTIQWQRLFYHSNSPLNDPRITVGAGSFLLTSGDTNYQSIAAKLPLDGSLTGTYADNRTGRSGQTWTYEVSTYTEAAASYTGSVRGPTGGFSSSVTNALGYNATGTTTFGSNALQLSTLKTLN